MSCYKVSSMNKKKKVNNISEGLETLSYLTNFLILRNHHFNYHAHFGDKEHQVNLSKVT